MNRKQMLIEEIRAALKPTADYCIQYAGVFFKVKDFDLSVGKPLPGARAKRMNHSGQYYDLGSYKMYF